MPDDQPPEVDPQADPGRPGALPPVAAAAERVAEFVMWWGDGRIDTFPGDSDRPPLYARDLEVLARAGSTPWVVYDHNHGPYAIALYDNASAASRHVARAGYGKTAPWPYGLELDDAIKQWEGE